MSVFKPGEPGRPQMHIGGTVMDMGADPLTAIQVQLMIMNRLLAEVLQQVGGEVVLAAGFRDRVTDESLCAETFFLPDGRYRVRVVETPPEYRRPKGRG